MRVKTIVNPYANRWKAKKRIPEIQTAFNDVNIEHVIVITTAPGQAIEEARIAAEQGFDTVVAAGGDGTVNEVANGLAQAAGDRPTIPMAVLPIGTGNDLSTMIGNPTDPQSIAQIVAAGKTRQIDLGQCNGRYFTNNCAVAMEPLITIENVKINLIKGNLRYIVALIKGLMKLKAWEMDVQWDDGSYSGPLFLLSVCNGPRTGGHFIMAPDASFDDGLFDFVMLPEVSKLTVMRLLPRLFSGSHVKDERVTYLRTRSVSVTSKPGTPIHADGEVIAEADTTVEYSIHPGKLTFLVP